MSQQRTEQEQADWDLAAEIIEKSKAADQQWEAADRQKATRKPLPMFDQVIGLMIVKDGMGWGVIYEDGRETNHGWLPMVAAPVHELSEYDRLREMIGPDAQHRELRRASIVHVRKYVEVTPLRIEWPTGQREQLG